MAERAAGRKAEKSTDRDAYAAGCAFVDGGFVPVGEARVPILDWGFLRSDATYDVAHVWRGRFFRLEDHLGRFERGMAELRMRPAYTLAASTVWLLSFRTSALIAKLPFSPEGSAMILIWSR